MINNPTAVGAVSNRTGSSAETLDMENPENLKILKILVQTILNKTNHANTR